MTGQKAPTQASKQQNRTKRIKTSEINETAVSEKAEIVRIVTSDGLVCYLSINLFNPLAYRKAKFSFFY